MYTLSGYLDELREYFDSLSDSQPRIKDLRLDFCVFYGTLEYIVITAESGDPIVDGIQMRIKPHAENEEITQFRIACSVRMMCNAIEYYDHGENSLFAEYRERD